MTKTPQAYPESDQRIDAGMALWKAGDLGAAETAFAAEPSDSVLKLVSLVNEAQVQMLRGDIDGALVSTERGIQHFREFGTQHPAAYVQVLRVRGQCLVERALYDRAAAVFDESLLVAETFTTNLADAAGTYATVLRAIQLETAHTLNSLGGLLLKALEPARAIVPLERARRLHENLDDPSKVGLAEVLTHLAQARLLSGDPTGVDYLLEEALDIVVATGNEAQRFRVMDTMSRLSIAETGIATRAAAESKRAALMADAAGQLSTAYVRWCIAADWADRANAAELVDEALRAADRLEKHLDAHDVNRPMIELTRARRMLQNGDRAKAIDVLINGCGAWRTLSMNMTSADVEQVTRKAHEHHLLLADLLLEDGRAEEALAAFEDGRSLAFAMDVGAIAAPPSAVPTRLTSRYPVTLVAQVRASLGELEVYLIPILLATKIGCFVVDSRETIFLDEPTDRAELTRQLNELPGALDNRVGANAIPAAVASLGRRLVEQLGGRSVAGIAPHSLMHVVPWRAVLRAHGASWDRLAAPVDFGLHSQVGLRSPQVALPTSAIALGHGRTPSGRNFEDEALEFAAVWGADAAVEVATANNLRAALSSTASVVHLSCHGIGFAADLSFDLADGVMPIEALLADLAVSAPIVLLSVCNSGSYFVRAGDHPVGAAPRLLRAGVCSCLSARFPVDAGFAATLLPRLGAYLRSGMNLQRALATVVEEVEREGEFDFWSDLACFEVLRARQSGSRTGEK